MRVLVLNPGSSTLKASLVTTSEKSAQSAVVEWPHADDADETHSAARVVRQIIDELPADIDAVGYRVVHGGTVYRAAAPVDADLLAAVEALDALAPLHNRRAAVVMRAAMDQLPGIPHVACFDSAYHADLPEHAWRYALPADWVERWRIRRYGFHGLSVAWSVQRSGELLLRRPEDLRLVVAHLGAGCSVTAVDRGRSVATSMGFTPLEGPMMATRSGSIDPGILLHLVRNGVSHDALADGLAHRSGLQAITGTADVREIERRAEGGDGPAVLALEMFAQQVAASIAASATALPALDAIVFTGGIGEHSVVIRAAVAGHLNLLGVPRQLKEVIADGIAAHGPPGILVVESREDLVIADEVAAVTDRAGRPAGAEALRGR